jgi:hypothetical protein
MLNEALQLLPAVEKLERVLGHNLNITRDILETRVREAIDRQVEHFGIIIQSLTTGGVDWARLVIDAAYRRPPFQRGEKEKGFRDAVILETFIQLVTDAPSSPTTARVVLVSSDQLLRDAAQHRLEGRTNVDVVDSVDALKGLINTLGSTVDEQFIAAIKDKAKDLFYKPNDKGSLYYRASVKELLNQALEGAKMQLPSGAERYTIEQWTINQPRFVRKQSQRIHWSTRFEARLKALKSKPWPTIEWSSPPPESPSQAFIGSGVGNAATISPLFFGSEGLPPSGYIRGLSANITPTSLYTPGLTPGLIGMDDQLVGYGTANLDVSWSLAVATTGKLTKPQLESVTFVEIVWD